MRQRDPADGASALEAFWAEVGAMVGEDLIDEVLGANGYPGREVTDPESEDFWEAQASASGQFGADGFSMDGLFIAVTSDPGSGEKIQAVQCGSSAPGFARQEAHQPSANHWISGQSR